MKNILENRIFVFLTFLIAVLILKFPIINLPYEWDVMTYIVPTAIEMSQNNLNPMVFMGGGHPPLFFAILALSYIIFGYSIQITHLITIFFSAIALFFTYLLGKEIYNTKVGITAPLILLTIPIYFSYSGLGYIEITLVAFTLMAAYFAIKDKKLLYILSGSVLVLLKEPGVIIIAGIALYKFLTNLKPFKIKESLIYASPIIAYLLWITATKLYFGWFFFPDHLSRFQASLYIPLLRLLFIAKLILIDNFRWILTSLIAISIIKVKSLRKYSITFIITLAFFILLTFLLSSFTTTFPNIENYASFLLLYSIPISLLAAILLTNIKQLSKKYITKKTGIFISITLTLTVFFSLTASCCPLKFFIPVYPFLAIISAKAITKLFKNKSFIIILIIMIIFITQFYGQRDSIGFILETNMEYRDMIETHQKAVKFIEENYQDPVVITSYPQIRELSSEKFGYVSKPIRYQTDFQDPSGRLDLPEINLKEADLVYYSPQSHSTASPEQLNTDLKLIKEFSKNNKKAQIYEIVK